MKQPDLVFKEVKTPLGILMFGSTAQGLCLLDFKYRKSFPRNIERIKRLYSQNIEYGTTDFIEQAEYELHEYLQGKSSQFTVPLDIRGTEFQLQVWNALLQIKYGKTVSYFDIAKKIGKPNSVRAVANANGQNTIAIIIPCHRVIGSDGTLTGYGGGIAIKKKLLELESVKGRMKITNFISKEKKKIFDV